MLAQRSARIARRVVMFAALAAGGLGCQHCEKKRSADCPPKDTCETTTDCLPTKPVKEACPAPECPAPVATCAAPKPQVEIKQPPPVHIRLPQPQVVLEAGQAPMAPAQPMAAPMAPQAPVAGGIERPINRARLGLTFGFIRLPIPVPRFIAVPTAPEVRVPLAPVAPVAPLAYQQPVAPMAYQQPVAPMVYQQPVAPVYAAPAAPIAAYQPTYPVAPVAAQPVAPVYQPVAAAPAAAHPAAPSTVADFCRQIDALKAALDAQKAALGCDDVKWRSR